MCKYHLKEGASIVRITHKRSTFPFSLTDTYYALTTVGIRVPWKKAVTVLQIVQVRAGGAFTSERRP